MATYKVIQDIEAEDHILGPLSLRQFIYALIAVFFGYISFVCVAKGLAIALIFLVPPMLFCAFFAWPWSPEQPTEVWALARIRFIVKSRKRIWDQSGVKEFVTVTVPKKIEKNYTDGLSQVEVRSRLQALAHTIDSRGWAVKNAYPGGGGQIVTSTQYQTDRLLGYDNMPQEVSSLDIRDSDDILDASNNTAQHMTQLVDAATVAHRQQVIDRMNGTLPQAVQPGQAWFNPVAQNQPVVTIQPSGQPQMPQPLASAQPVPHQVMPQSMPATMQQQSATLPVQPLAQSQPDPAILNLAHNDNLDVATLAREAKRAKDLEASGDEVVVSLR